MTKLMIRKIKDRYGIYADDNIITRHKEYSRAVGDIMAIYCYLNRKDDEDQGYSGHLHDCLLYKASLLKDDEKLKMELEETSVGARLTFTDGQGGDIRDFPITL
jgi:hypothetical protein